MELSAKDVGRIGGLAWGGEDPLNGASPFVRHGGRTFLAHRPDGDCVYLDAARGLCQIHARFGAEAKPHGCRLYPFQIVPTFSSGAPTVTARFDCPTVRRNDGAPHTESLRELTRLAKQMTLATPFDERARCSFDHEQIDAVCEFAGTLMGAFETNDRRALFLAFLCDWLRGRAAGGEGFDRSDLAGAFPELKADVESAATAPQARAGMVVRVAFRTLLGLYLRRDEDVLNGLAGRVGRLVAMGRFALGFGRFTGLGVTHPPGSLRLARRFDPGPAALDPSVFELHWRMIRVKLDTFHFMGSANRGHDFLSGLGSLALLYPLVLSAARYRAAGRGAAVLDATDVDYGVAAIEHSYGRSAVLAQAFARSIESFLLRREQFGRLLKEVAGGEVVSR